MLNIYNINDGKCVTFTLLKYSFGFIFSNVTFEKSKKMNDNFERENIPNELTIMIDDTIYKQLKMIETVFDSFITWQGCKLTNIYHTQHTKFKMSVRGTRISISFSNNVSTGSCDDITIDYGKATLFIVPMWRVTNVHPRDDFASNLLKVPHISNDEKNEYFLTVQEALNTIEVGGLFMNLKQIKVEEQRITSWADILKENNIEDSNQNPDGTDSVSDSDSASASNLDID